MRYLGIDFGLKRVGIAVSDETNSFAFPLVVLDGEGSLLEEIVKICEENDVGAVVMGESKDFNQNENEIMKAVKPFIKTMEDRLGLPVYTHPEFMTSQEAERLQGKNDMHDASAAAIILKSYLDTINNKKHDIN